MKKFKKTLSQKKKKILTGGEPATATATPTSIHTHTYAHPSPTNIASLFSSHHHHNKFSHFFLSTKNCSFFLQSAFALLSFQHKTQLRYDYLAFVLSVQVYRRCFLNYWKQIFH
ncbi:hypothetical protein ACOSQ4_031634 [Xanthoceras sorbifolium]